MNKNIKKQMIVFVFVYIGTSLLQSVVVSFETNQLIFTTLIDREARITFAAMIAILYAINTKQVLEKK
jgi:hypothetical protein